MKETEGAGDERKRGMKEAGREEACSSRSSNKIC